MNTENLKNLLQNCLLLKPERRNDLLAHIDTLNEMQIQEMCAAITEANSSLKNTITSALENPENQEKINSFNQEIDQIWKKHTQDTENISNEIEKAEADKMLTDL